MKRVLLLFGLVLMTSVVRGKHLHPRSLVRLGEIEVENDNKNEKMVAEFGGSETIDVIRNVRPNRFVPINNLVFFNSNTPCEEGLKRDVLGFCREVWD